MSKPTPEITLSNDAFGPWEAATANVGKPVKQRKSKIHKDGK